MQPILCTSNGITLIKNLQILFLVIHHHKKINGVITQSDSASKDISKFYLRGKYGSNLPSFEFNFLYFAKWILFCIIKIKAWIKERIDR